MSEIVRAISIRQPYVELILQGKKTEEYRSKITHIRERVYLYASRTPSDREESWEEVDKQPGDLPTGQIVGSVEITDCYWNGFFECYAYVLKNPLRLKQFLTPINQAQPVFWRPKF